MDHDYNILYIRTRCAYDRYKQKEKSSFRKYYLQVSGDVSNQSRDFTFNVKI